VPDGEVEDYTVTINPVTPSAKFEIIPDPEYPGLKELSIAGTANADTITVNQKTFPLQVTVTINGKTSAPISEALFTRIVVYAGAGNDTVTINAARPALIHGEAGADRLFGGSNNDEIYGDDGNDYLSGGSGNDILIGGVGNDTLLGGNGRDVLIGGTGVDNISDSSGDNILIGGSTDQDANHAALQQIMATWSSTRVEDTFLARIAKLGPNGAKLITSSTVHDDLARDTLNGGSGHTGHDWFLDYSLSTSVTKDLILNFIASKDKKN
jgi:Ca2+-binding RTX toxin-like protein